MVDLSSPMTGRRRHTRGAGRDAALVAADARLAALLARRSNRDAAVGSADTSVPRAFGHDSMSVHFDIWHGVITSGDILAPGSFAGRADVRWASRHRRGDGSWSMTDLCAARRASLIQTPALTEMAGEIIDVREHECRDDGVMAKAGTVGVSTASAAIAYRQRSDRREAAGDDNGVDEIGVRHQMPASWRSGMRAVGLRYLPYRRRSILEVVASGQAKTY